MDASFSEPHLVIASCLIDFIFIPQLASERSDNERRFFEHCEKGYNLDPNNPDAISLKGVSFYLKQDPERMVEFIKKALESNPNHPRSLEMYSIQLQREGEAESETIIFRPAQIPAGLCSLQKTLTSNHKLFQ